MLAKWLLANLTVVALATPALSDQFYIVRDATTDRCVIAERPPEEGAGVVVGDGTYGDRNVAEAEMKAMYVCISQQTDSRTQDAAPPAPSR